MRNHEGKMLKISGYGRSCSRLLVFEDWGQAISNPYETDSDLPKRIQRIAQCNSANDNLVTAWWHKSRKQVSTAVCFFCKVVYSIYKLRLAPASVFRWKQDTAHEPECSHVEHLCATSYLNSLVHFAPVTVAVHCRLWNAKRGWSAKCGAWRKWSVEWGSVVCRVWSADCGVYSVRCGVESVKCRV